MIILWKSRLCHLFVSHTNNVFRSFNVPVHTLRPMEANGTLECGVRRGILQRRKDHDFGSAIVTNGLITRTFGGPMCPVTVVIVASQAKWQFDRKTNVRPTSTTLSNGREMSSSSCVRLLQQPITEYSRRARAVVNTSPTKRAATRLRPWRASSSTFASNQLLPRSRDRCLPI